MKKKVQDKVEEKKKDIRMRNDLHYRTINELEVGNYFGEIAALSNLRRTCSVIAVNSMVIGKIKISAFRDFIQRHSNVHKKINKKIQSYKD